MGSGLTVADRCPMFAKTRNAQITILQKSGRVPGRFSPSGPGIEGGLGDSAQTRPPLKAQLATTCLLYTSEAADE